MVYGVLLAAAVIQTLWYWPRLLDRVVSTYDAAGDPSGSMAKPLFFALHLLMVAVCVVVFAGLEVILRKAPPSLINIPNREYWLAPDRREATYGRLGESIRSYGTATLVFLIVLAELVIRQNLWPESSVPTIGLWIAASAFVVFTVAWVIRFLLMFRVEP